MLNYDHLPSQEKRKDFLFAAIVRALASDIYNASHPAAARC
jgi:hypothetical protein